MLKLCKKLYSLCNTIFKSCISFLSCMLFSSYKTAIGMQKLRKELKGKYGQCHIFGNGPALVQTMQNSLRPSGDSLICTVNFFTLTDMFFKIKPQMHIFIDPILWKDEAINNSTEKKFFETKNNVKKFLKSLQLVDWKMYLFVPNRCPLDIFKDISPTVKIIPINTTPISGWKKFSHILYNLGYGMPLPQNVTNAAIFLAIFLRFEKIYLYGANHSWMLDLRVDEQNRIYTEDSHFYKNSENRYYFNKGILEQYLRCYANAFASHTALDEYSRAVGVRVYNRTQGSFIDAYEFDMQQ